MEQDKGKGTGKDTLDSPLKCQKVIIAEVASMLSACAVLSWAWRG